MQVWVDQPAFNFGLSLIGAEGGGSGTRFTLTGRRFGSSNVNTQIDADANFDGITDGLDFLQWQAAAGHNTSAVPVLPTDFDFDFDVDSDDLAVWLAAYGDIAGVGPGTSSPMLVVEYDPPSISGSSVVPEPTSFLLVTAGLLLALNSRSRTSS